MMRTPDAGGLTHSQHFVDIIFARKLEDPLVLAAFRACMKEGESVRNRCPR